MRQKILCLLMLIALGVPALAQETKPASEKSVDALKPALPPGGIPVPAEIQELLADRDLLSAEIERIINAEGEAVKIPVSLRTLSARREAKTQRWLAWLEAQKIPREWRAAGWRLEKWVFLPPATPAEKKPHDRP